jgi:hypothetical protein
MLQYMRMPVPGYPHILQLYWNQTKYEEMVAGRGDGGGYGAMCYGAYSPDSLAWGDRL